MHSASSVPLLHSPFMQQAPVEQLTHGQMMPSPWKTPPASVQSTMVPLSSQLPSPMQQAPGSGCGQLVVEQSVSVPWGVPPAAMQSISGTASVQVPSDSQQAPGCGQVTLAQSLPGPWKTKS